MTDDEFKAWLADSTARRVLLMETAAGVDGVETLFYFSAHGAYLTEAADVPANEIYKPIAKVGVLYTERIDTSGRSGLSAGVVKVSNPNGIRDDWKRYAWKNRPFKALIGDATWARAEYRMIFNGVTEDFVADGADGFDLTLCDKLQLLNTPLSEKKLGGTSPQRDAYVPYCFGQCANIRPLLVDQATQRYMVHDGPIEGIIEVRINGLPITNYTPDLATGTFTIDGAVYGDVTCSVRGEKFGGVYRYSVASIIRRIVTGYGDPVKRFTEADLDAANLDAFDQAHPQAVGIYVSDRRNVITACQELAASVGAQMISSRLGLLRLVQLALPGAGSPMVIRPKHMKDGRLAPTNTLAPEGAVTLTFCRNWTQQTGLTSRIPQAHKDLYAAPYFSETARNEATIIKYRLTGDPVQQDTLLNRRSDAQVEARRRADFRAVPREGYEFEGTPEMLMLELGQAVTLFHLRYGMSAGVPGIAMMLAPNWLNGHVKVGVLI